MRLELWLCTTAQEPSLHRICYLSVMVTQAMRFARVMETVEWISAMIER
jgi:hypothetical protein